MKIRDTGAKTRRVASREVVEPRGQVLQMKGAEAAYISGYVIGKLISPGATPNPSEMRMCRYVPMHLST